MSLDQFGPFSKQFLECIKCTLCGLYGCKVKKDLKPSLWSLILHISNIADDTAQLSLLSWIYLDFSNDDATLK